MAQRYRITTGPLNWSPQKAKMMRRDILVFLAQNGAPNCQWEEVGKDGQAAPVEPITYVHLQCMKCRGKWYAERFTECPTCGTRNDVKKASIARRPLPAGIALGQIVPEKVPA